MLMMLMMLRSAVGQDKAMLYAGVVRELERSVEAYPQRSGFEEAAEVVRALANDLRSESLFVVSNRVFAFKRFVDVSKRRKHAATLLAMKHLGHALPSAAYAVNAMSTGDIAEFARQDVPIAVISKKYGYNMPGILVPNPFFAEGDLRKWTRQSRELKTAAEAAPWYDRDPRLFWRGNIGSHGEDCERDSGNYARFAAVSLSAENASLFDVKCNKCRPANDTTCAPYDSTMRALLKGGIRNVQDPAWVEARDYVRYRAVLNLPGTTSGGYSRNLNHLWALGAVVALWNTSVVEWYYPSLRTGTTHLVLDKTNAAEAMDRLRRGLFDVPALLDGAKRVRDSLVCGECQARYILDMLAAIRRRFAVGLVLDDPAKFAAVLRSIGVDCAADLVELEPHPRWHNHTSRSMLVLERPLPPAAIIFDAEEEEETKQQQQQQQYQGYHAESCAAFHFASSSSSSSSSSSGFSTSSRDSD